MMSNQQGEGTQSYKVQKFVVHTEDEAPASNSTLNSTQQRSGSMQSSNAPIFWPDQNKAKNRWVSTTEEASRMQADRSAKRQAPHK